MLGFRRGGGLTTAESAAFLVGMGYTAKPYFKYFIPQTIFERRICSIFPLGFLLKHGGDEQKQVDRQGEGTGGVEPRRTRLPDRPPEYQKEVWLGVGRQGGGRGGTTAQCR